jgi:parallel beta-helix repeat protein
LEKIGILRNDGDGIYLESPGPVPASPGHANVTDNQISYNTGNGIYMFNFDGGRVQGNQLENNTNGIVMYGVSEYTLTDNYLANQSSYGIQMFQYSRYNKIYHNDFVDNKNPVDIDGTSSASWNDSYPSGGNYWSNYTGNDTKKGPYQNINGQDGIGDTPYVIDVNNHDNYPLSPSTQPSHDIGLLNPEQWKTFVCQGFPLCTYGSIINYGNNDENVSIIAYASGFLFDSKNSTLQARTWNATGFNFTSKFGWNTRA